MKEKIRQFANGQFHKKTPKISISAERLSIEIERGEDYHGSFLVTSTNEAEMKGFLQTTNPAVQLGSDELRGKSQQIAFSVRGAELEPYEEQEGEIQLLTNGGEFFLPFTIAWKEDRWLETEFGTVRDLRQFAAIARMDREKARKIFASPYFPERLLREQPRALFLYRQLCKGSSLECAMDQFLLAHGYGKKNTPERSPEEEAPAREQPPGQGGETGAGGNRREEKKEARFSVKRIQSSIMELYLAYRTNHIGLGDYIGKTLDRISEYEQYGQMPPFYYLLRLHMYVLGENPILYVAELPVCREKCRLLSRASEENCYLHYIEALYSGKEEQIQETAEFLRSVIKANPKKAAPFLALIYLDREYADNLELQFRTIKKYFALGLNTPLFYFEACDILNRDQNLLQTLGPFELFLLNWGCRYQYLSMEVVDRFANLAIREKNFDQRVFSLLEKFYRQDPKKEYLTAICSCLIKGNQVSREYHAYLKKGVESDLKIIGIQEAYIRTLDEEEFEILPQELLRYFLHSGNLGAGEQAYYYANLVVNRLYYEELYESYLPRIDAFLLDAMKKGKMDRFLEILFRERLKTMELTEEIAAELPNVLYKKKITCANPEIDGVLVYHMEEKHGRFYEWNHGAVYADLYTDHPLILFTDRERRRYVDAGQSVVPVFDAGAYEERLLAFRDRNPKLLLSVYGKYEDGGAEDETFMAAARDLLRVDTIADPFRIEVLRRIIGFYSGNRDGDMLDQYLRQIDLSFLSGKDRAAIMELLIRRQRYDQAVDAVRAYGYGRLGAGALMNLGQYLAKDDLPETRELAVNACWLAFRKGRYDSGTVAYLAKYCVAAVRSLLPIWEAANGYGLDTTELEDTILALALFTESDDDVYPVFRSYAEKRDSGVLTEAFLQYGACQYMVSDKKLPEEFFDILHQAIRRNMAKGPFSRMALLKNYSERVSSLDEEQIRMARRLLDVCIGENMILPYFRRFTAVADLPAEILMKTVVACYSDGEKDVELHYNIATRNRAEDTFTSEYMREILPGIYTREFMLFADEELFYYITQDGETMVDIAKVSGREQCEGCSAGHETRFRQLNRALLFAARGQGEEAEELARRYYREMYLARLPVKIL